MKKQHWLTEAIMEAYNNGSSYMDATYSIMFQFHGALNSVLSEEMTQERKMKEVEELNAGLNEALETFKRAKGLLK